MSKTPLASRNRISTPSPRPCRALASSPRKTPPYVHAHIALALTEQPADGVMQWACTTGKGFQTETQVWYSVLNDGTFLMVQVIWSYLGWVTTCYPSPSISPFAFCSELNASVSCSFPPRRK